MDTNSAYLESFKARIEAAETYGKIFGDDPEMIRKKMQEQDDQGENQEKAIEVAREKHLAMRFLVQSDKSRCGKLLDELANDLMKSHDNYPSTMTAALDYLNKYSDARGGTGAFLQREAMNFANVSEESENGDEAGKKNDSTKRFCPKNIAAKCPKHKTKADESGSKYTNDS